ncbi:SOS response-associated peptidase [Hyphomicrobium sp.]|uniref:SOS response-associated peptidase n=1 Tax=Hyphomicrobium sp. TaxID=82 RepID=UPI002C5F2E8E|nr:SOS response-associated peptidase [Hyphomicrobium sp.]HVZ04154.1 SOS response-associated peptidase [Hyphomicrobium sp.]
MCSRYSLIARPEAVYRLFGITDGHDFPPRYNIAPSQPVLIVRHDALHIRECALVQWGLVPAWVKDPREYKPLLNARSETITEKPSFRGPVRHRRCLVPASGYYEWVGGRRSKQPHFIRMTQHALFAIAGIWEVWLGADGSEIETMAILTTAANSDVSPIHDRMPVIIRPPDYDRWLDCRSGSTVEISELLRCAPDGCMSVAAVNPRLNDPRAEGPDLHEPANPTLF